MKVVNDENVKTSENQKQGTARRQFFKRLFKEKPLGVFSLVVIVLIIILGVFANVISPYGMNETSYDKLQGPSSDHIFGTDNLGRDLFTRINYGARVSLIVGFGGTLLSIVISLFIGVTSAYIGGKFDIIIQRFVDAWICFPGLILLIGMAAIFGSGIWQLILILGISRGIGGSRVTRSAVYSIKSNLYVTAAVSIGASRTYIMLKHIIPNIMGITIVMITTRFPGMVLAEASLSFLGLGIAAPTPTWGGMLSGAGRYYMLVNPWIAIWPGVFLSLFVFAANMLGDAIRDLLDPRLRGGTGRYNVLKKQKLVTGKILPTQ